MHGVVELLWSTSVSQDRKKKWIQVGAQGQARTELWSGRTGAPRLLCSALSDLPQACLQFGASNHQMPGQHISVIVPYHIGHDQQRENEIGNVHNAL
eukprot:7386189-Prymnesium_polylepis.1